MPTLSLSLLGPFAGTIEQEPLGRFPTRSSLALLIYLAVEGQAGGPLQREMLAELLFPGFPPASSKKNLRQALYELRQVLAEHFHARDLPLILADRQTLELSPHWITILDINEFEANTRSSDVNELENAAALYRADFLSDFYLPDSGSFENWIDERRVHYRGMATDLFSRLTERFLQDQDYNRAEIYARRQLSLDELNENASRQLMMSLAARDQRAAALSEFERARTELARQLDVEPSSQTLDLYHDILHGNYKPPVREQVDLLSNTVAKPEDASEALVDKGSPNNLPPQPTPFVGREEELVDIRDLVCDMSTTRLVTLLGPGGSGKSRLALEAGSRLAQDSPGDFPDGIWYVPLAALSSPSSVVPEVAKTVNLTFVGDDIPHKQQLIDYLASKKLLLILDNYEQLLDGQSTPIPADILTRAPEVRVIVTSRIRLNIRGEQLFPVSGLAFPTNGSSPDLRPEHSFSAIALFVQNARRVRHEFEVTDDNWPAIVKICQMLDGLPLAIELAATWIEVLTPAEIASEIESNLDILSSEWADMPDRQSSMRAVFNASWELLSPTEQKTLRHLSVFRGPFNRNAAAAVAGIDLRGLLTLMNKSWLIRDGQGIFNFHEVLRQFCLEKLEANEASWRSVRDRHAAYYLNWLADLDSSVRGHGQKEALMAIDESFENIRLTWNWLAGEGHFDDLVNKMLLPIFLFCVTRNRGKDVAEFANSALKETDNREEKWLESTILEVATLAAHFGDYLPSSFNALNLHMRVPQEKTIQLWNTLKNCEPRHLDAFWLVTITIIYTWVTRSSNRTIPFLRNLMNEYRETNDRWALAFTMKNLAFIMGDPIIFASRETADTVDELFIDEMGEVDILLKRAASIFEELGDRLAQADTLRLYGQIYHFTHPESVVEPLLKARQLYKELGDPLMGAHIVGILALRSLWLGHVEESFDLFKEKIDYIKAIGNQAFLAYTYGHEAIHALRYYSVDFARELRMKSGKMFVELGYRSDLAWNYFELGDIERTAGNLDLARSYFEKARRLFEEEGIVDGEIFYTRGIADYSLAAGDNQAAIDYYRRSLELARYHNHFWAASYALCGLSLAYLVTGEQDVARKYCYEALHQTQVIRQNDMSMIALTGLAQIRAEQGDPEGCLLLATFVENHNLSWLTTKELARALMASASEQLPEETAAEIQERARSMKKQELVDLVYEQEKSGEVAT